MQERLQLRFIKQKHEPDIPHIVARFRFGVFQCQNEVDYGSKIISRLNFSLLVLGFTCFCLFAPTDPVLMSLKDSYRRPNQLVFKAPVKEKKSVVVNGIDLLENVPPRTENEVCKEAGGSRTCSKD